MAQSILTYAVGTFVALFPITNPIGAVPVFYSLTETDSSAEHRHNGFGALNRVFGFFILAIAQISQPNIQFLEPQRWHLRHQPLGQIQI